MSLPNSVADQVKALMHSTIPEQLPLLAPSTRTNQITEAEWQEFQRAKPRNNPKSKASPYRSTAFDYYDPYIGYTQTTNTTAPRGAPKTYSTKKVRVVSTSGQTQDYTIPFDCVEWFEIAKASYPFALEQGHEILTIPIDRCEFSYGEPVFNACVYTAVQDYVSARWGRKLDESDRRWLARHPLSTDAGVPQEYTLTAIQQLVAPYGMQVSRVRLRAGALVLGDQIMQWAMALGCNPMALADRRTTNAAASQLMGMDEQAANALWRLEFSDTPLPGSIIGERGWSNTQGVSVGAMGGHARYLAPRAMASDWFVSIQLAPDADVEYLVPPPNPEYVERKGASTLLVSKTLDLQGQLIAVRHGTTWRAFGETPTRVVAVPASAPEPIRTPGLTIEPFSFDCLICGEANREADRCYDRTHIDICVDCATEAWRDVRCPGCNHTPHYYDIPFPMTVHAADFTYQCEQCRAEFTVPFESEEEYMQPLITFSCAAFYEDVNLVDVDVPTSPR